MTLIERLRMSPSVGEPGYLPYCGACPTMHRMVRGEHAFKCMACGLETRRVNGEDIFDRTALTTNPQADKGDGA